LPSFRSLRKPKRFHMTSSVVVFGESIAGKTTVCRRLTQKNFAQGMTRVTEYYNTEVCLSSKRLLCYHKLTVHDTPANLRETFPHLYESAIRENDAFILVFSLASSSGISFIRRALNDLKNIKGGHQAPVLVVANKADIESTEESDITERFNLYRDLSTTNIPVVETTALTSDAQQSAAYTRNWIPLLVDIEERYDVHREINAIINLKE